MAVHLLNTSGVVNSLNSGGTIPGSSDEGRSSLDRWEANAGNPVIVDVEGVLALTKGVPELDGVVTGRGDNLSVVRREGNREDLLGMTDETTGGLAGGNLPETKGLVPRTGEGEVTIG